MASISIEQLFNVNDNQLQQLRNIKHVQNVKWGNFDKAECVFTNASGMGVVVEVPLNTDTDRIASDIRTVITNSVPFGITYRGY